MSSNASRWRSPGSSVHDRLDHGVGEADIGGPGGHRRRHPRFALGGDGGDDRLLATGEVVVVGPRRDPGRLGDVVDTHVVRPAFERQPQRRLTQRLPGGLLLLLA